MVLGEMVVTGKRREDSIDPGVAAEIVVMAEGEAIAMASTVVAWESVFNGFEAIE